MPWKASSVVNKTGFSFTLDCTSKAINYPNPLASSTIGLILPLIILDLFLILGQSCCFCTGGSVLYCYYIAFGFSIHNIFTGVYISKTSYIRQGEKSLDGFYRAWHHVEYYRWMFDFNRCLVVICIDATADFVIAGTSGSSLTATSSCWHPPRTLWPLSLACVRRMSGTHSLFY